MTTAVTKESLIARIADLEYGARSLKEDYTLAAYKILLATMESEPVAWTSEEAIEEVYCDETGMIGPKHLVGDVPLYRHPQPTPVVPASKKEPISFDEWSRKCALQITLCYPDFREKAKYIWDSARETQQPAPVVPDDAKLRELFDSWFASDCSFDLSPEASEADNIAWRESYWYVWQRCRAAMIAASPQPAPVLTFDEWCVKTNQKPQGWVREAMKEAYEGAINQK